MAARQLLLCPVHDRGRVAVQYIAQAHYRTRAWQQLLAIGSPRRRGEQCRGYGEAKRLCSFQINRKCEFRRLVDWDVCWFCALEDLVDLARPAINHVVAVRQPMDGKRCLTANSAIKYR
jgi:hypothetical protein